MVASMVKLGNNWNNTGGVEEFPELICGNSFLINKKPALLVDRFIKINIYDYPIPG